MKRIRRKKLKEDELVSTMTKVIDFVKKQSKKLMAAALVVLLIALAFVVVKVFQTQASTKEGQVLTRILTLSSELDEHPENVAELEKLAGKRKFSRIACIELAAYWYKKGDFSRAETSLSPVSSRHKDMIYYRAQDLLGLIYIQQKNLDKAIHLYERIEQENPNHYPVEAVLFHKAQALEEKGEMEKARALYKKIQDEYSQTLLAKSAMEKLNSLNREK